jgi:2'-5' RNA ligase
VGTVTIGVSIAVPEPHGSQLQQLRAGFGDAAAHGIPTHVTLLPPTWLQKQVRDASGPVARELNFPYHPHVTVAHGIAEEAMDRAFEELAGYEAQWPCTGFALYEQGSDGVWRKLREFAFGGSVVPSQAGAPVGDSVTLPLGGQGRS